MPIHVKGFSRSDEVKGISAIDVDCWLLQAIIHQWRPTQALGYQNGPEAVSVSGKYETCCTGAGPDPRVLRNLLTLPVQVTARSPGGGKPALELYPQPALSFTPSHSSCSHDGNYVVLGGQRTEVTSLSLSCLPSSRGQRACSRNT